MKATKDYGPCAACKKPIKKGNEFAIKGGEFYHGKCGLEGGTPTADAPAATPAVQPRRRSPAQSAAAAPPAVPPSGKRTPRKRKATGSQKPPKRATTSPTTRRSPKLSREADSGKAAESAQSSTKPRSRVTRTAESPNGITVRLLCGQQSTDDEIVKAVVTKYPDRDETRIRSDISVNRSEINRGHYKSSREKHGLGPDAKIEKLVKVGKKRVPVSKAPAGK